MPDLLSEAETIFALSSPPAHQGNSGLADGGAQHHEVLAILECARREFADSADQEPGLGERQGRDAGFGARFAAPVFAKPVAWRILDGAIAVLMLVLAVLLVV